VVLCTTKQKTDDKQINSVHSSERCLLYNISTEAAADYDTQHGMASVKSNSKPKSKSRFSYTLRLTRLHLHRVQISTLTLMSGTAPATEEHKKLLYNGDYWRTAADGTSRTEMYLIMHLASGTECWRRHHGKQCALKNSAHSKDCYNIAPARRDDH